MPTLTSNEGVPKLTSEEQRLADKFVRKDGRPPPLGGIGWVGLREPGGVYGNQKELEGDDDEDERGRVVRGEAGSDSAASSARTAQRLQYDDARHDCAYGRDEGLFGGHDGSFASHGEVTEAQAVLFPGWEVESEREEVGSPGVGWEEEGMGSKVAELSPVSKPCGVFGPRIWCPWRLKFLTLTLCAVLCVCGCVDACPRVGQDRTCAVIHIHAGSKEPSEEPTPSDDAEQMRLHAQVRGR
jgi:hypothetical protein